MPFPTISKAQILRALAEVGVAQGDQVYVASFMAILGNGPTLLDDTIDALWESVGPSGTVIMPAFNWDYCSGVTFDVEETPAQTGVLCEAFRTRPDVQRSLSPPWATFCARGRMAKRIAGIRSTSPFDSDSIAQYMVDSDVKYVLIGCDFNHAVFHIHWLEEKFEVPYRYWKEFRGQVRIGGKLVEDISKMYARYLDTDVEVLIEASRLTDAFEESGQVQVAKLGLGEIRCFSTRCYVDFLMPFFEQDPFVVLAPEAKFQFN